MKHNTYALDLMEKALSALRDLKDYELSDLRWDAEDGSELSDSLGELWALIDDFIFEVNDKMTDIDDIIDGDNKVGDADDIDEDIDDDED